MFLFAFNFYKQINLFIKYIFTNKDITIPYYIYSCFVRSSPLPVLMLYQPGALLVVPPPPPAGGSCLPSFTILATLRGPSTTTSRGSCLPSLTILPTLRGKPPPPALEAACRISLADLILAPGILPAVLHPLEGILHPATGKGHTRHSSARRAVAPLNRSCRNEFIGVITLIVNYLDATLGCLLQVDIQSKILILNYLQG